MSAQVLQGGREIARAADVTDSRPPGPRGGSPVSRARVNSGGTPPAALLRKAVENTRWRQHECINLIPSEMTASPMVRQLSITDPAFRYAEHKGAKAFYETEIFYYQGTDFIAEVEWLLEEEFRKYLGCVEAETRVISGQMANMTVFSAMVDYINRADRRREPRRIRSVLNNHIGKGRPSQRAADGRASGLRRPRFPH